MTLFSVQYYLLAHWPAHEHAVKTDVERVVVVLVVAHLSVVQAELEQEADEQTQEVVHLVIAKLTHLDLLDGSCAAFPIDLLVTNDAAIQ